MKFLSVAATAIVALAPATAQAFGTGDEAGMQTLYDADGGGLLFANGPNTAWERCGPGLSTCESAGTAQQIGTGDAAPGTVFRLAGAPTGPVWHGNLAVLAPPGVQGIVRADELVTPMLATWQGGWERSFDQTQLAACQSPTGEGCVSITAHKYVGGCPGGGAVIDPSFVGDYLRIADGRFGPGTVETADAYTSPYGHEIWSAGGRVAVAMAGPILPAVDGQKTHCGPPPLVEAWISSRGVAKVSCAFGCQATLTVGHLGGTAWATRRIPATGLPPVLGQPNEARPSGSTLAVPPAKLKRLGGGRTHFSVEVGGHTFARRWIRLPKPKGDGDRHRHQQGKR